MSNEVKRPENVTLEGGKKLISTFVGNYVAVEGKHFGMALATAFIFMQENNRQNDLIRILLQSLKNKSLNTAYNRAVNIAAHVMGVATVYERDLGTVSCKSIKETGIRSDGKGKQVLVKGFDNVSEDERGVYITRLLKGETTAIANEVAPKKSKTSKATVNDDGSIATHSLFQTEALELGNYITEALNISPEFEQTEEFKAIHSELTALKDKLKVKVDALKEAAKNSVVNTGLVKPSAEVDSDELKLAV